MPTLLDYPQVTLMQSQSPTLPYGWPELPDKRKFGSVAHKKLRFKLHMFQNSKITSFLYLYFSFWLHFLAKCMLFIANNYISESLIRWVFNKLKSLTDRSTFFPWNCSNNKKEIFQGGLHWQILLGGGAGPKKNLQIWDLKRLVSLHSQVDFCMTDYMRRQVVISILKKWISQKWKLFAIMMLSLTNLFG